jgi:hypothetical protein
MKIFNVRENTEKTDSHVNEASLAKKIWKIEELNRQ